jgi:hypothetical protein
MNLLESMLDPSCSPLPVKRDESYMARVQDSMLAPDSFAVKTKHHHHFQGLTELWPSVMVSTFRCIRVCFRDHIGDIRFRDL